LIHLLYRALESPNGIEVETNNRELLRARLYKLQKKDPSAFGELAFVFPVYKTCLWIMRKNPDDPTDE